MYSKIHQVLVIRNQISNHLSEFSKRLINCALVILKNDLPLLLSNKKSNEENHN